MKNKINFKSSVLFVWQLGVNIIGLPILYKVTETKQVTRSVFLKEKTNIYYKILKYEQKQ